MRGPLREITLALAPPDEPMVELPTKQLEDLESLYEVLMRPLPPVPTQRERVDKLRDVVEADDADAFFALPYQDRGDAESHAHRIRCLGAQGKLSEAHTAFDEIREFDGLSPTPACYHALADACARSGNVEAAERVIDAVKRARLPLTAPLYTSLIGAHRRATRATVDAVDVSDIAADVLRRARRAGIVEDAPLHTSIICWMLAAGQPKMAWEAFHESRKRGIAADAVTYTSMMVACAQGDQLELAQNLQMEMRLHQIAPTLATHNAFISACASRAASLTELPRFKHEQLQRLKVDIDVRSPVRLADSTLQMLIGEGHKPDGRTFLSLLRVAEGAADVGRAQSLLTRLLDSGLACEVAHFNSLLRACIRGQRYRPPELADLHCRVALAAPPSMVALGLEVSVGTIDRVLLVFVQARRVHAAVRVLDEMYDAYGLAPGPLAFEHMLRMGERMRLPRLASDLLERMESRGLTPTEEQQALPARLLEPSEELLHPPLPERAWSSRHGYYKPELSAATREKWTVTVPPGLLSASPTDEASLEDSEAVSAIIRSGARQLAELEEGAEAHGLHECAAEPPALSAPELEEASTRGSDPNTPPADPS